MNNKIMVLIFCAFLIFSLDQACAENIKEKFEHAFKCSATGQFDEAIKLYKEINQAVPQFAPAYNYLGLALKESGGTIKETIEAFENSIKADPKYAEAYSNLSRIYYTLGDFDKSITYGKQAVELDPSSVSANLTMGWTYLVGKSDGEEAVGYFQSVIENSEEFAYALFGLGMSYYVAGKNFEVFDQITKLKANGHNELADQLEDVIRKGKFDPKSGIQSSFFPPVIRPRAVPDEAMEAMAAQNRAPSPETMTAQGQTPDKSYKVRLKKRGPRFSEDYLDDQEIQPNDVSNEDLIKQLQENSRKINPEF